MEYRPKYSPDPPCPPWLRGGKRWPFESRAPRRSAENRASPNRVEDRPPRRGGECLFRDTRRGDAPGEIEGSRHPLGAVEAIYRGVDFSEESHVRTRNEGMSNDECLKKLECRNPNDEGTVPYSGPIRPRSGRLISPFLRGGLFASRISSFGLRHSLDIRHSTFELSTRPSL